MLGEIGAVHRATDPPLGQEARAGRRGIAKKGVIEIAEAGGEVLLGLGARSRARKPPGRRAAKAWRARSWRKAIQSERGAAAMPSRAYCRASMV